MYQEKRCRPGPNHHLAMISILQVMTLVKKMTGLRIFAAFANVNEEDASLHSALDAFGEVIRFRWDFDEQYHPDWHFSGKQRMNQRMIETLKTAHATKPIDIFFGYLSGRTVFPGIIRHITQMGIPTFCMSLDDKEKFFGALEFTGFTGMADIANAFTLCWTNTEDAVAEYAAVGGRAIYLPPGASPNVFRPYDLPCDIDVSFVGQKYGQRPAIIQALRERGIGVKTFGKGWASGEIPQEEMVRIYSRSKITLGLAGAAGADQSLCLKGRDFEVPMSGGFYLTQYHPELEHFFDIGREIVCYRTIDDLAEKIRHFLNNPAELEKIRAAGHKRAIRDHTWVGRFRVALRRMGISCGNAQEMSRRDSLPSDHTEPAEDAAHILKRGEHPFLQGKTEDACECFAEVLS
jgi:spore maturation protein CgeB